MFKAKPKLILWLLDLLCRTEYYSVQATWSCTSQLTSILPKENNLNSNKYLCDHFNVYRWLFLVCLHLQQIPNIYANLNFVENWKPPKTVKYFGMEQFADLTTCLKLLSLFYTKEVCFQNMKQIHMSRIQHKVSLELLTLQLPTYTNFLPPAECILFNQPNWDTHNAVYFNSPVLNHCDSRHPRRNTPNLCSAVTHHISH